MTEGSTPVDACPACGEASFTATALRGQPFSICHGCELVFANPMPEDDVDSADVYLTGDIDEVAALEKVENQKARIQAIERFRAPGTLWDVGSGPGFLVKAAQMMGWEAAGCEVSVGCCKFGRETLGVPIYPTSFPGLPVAAGVPQVDVITAFHVLEHLPEPKEFVRFTSSALKPGGLLVVEIPNLFSFESLYLRDSWHGLALPAHLGFYTPKSLRTLFQRSFRIVSLEYSIATYFHESIAEYLDSLAVSRDLIDVSARQFSGTAMVVYLERVEPNTEPDPGEGIRAFLRRTPPYRAGRRLRRFFGQRRR